MKFLRYSVCVALKNIYDKAIYNFFFIEYKHLMIQFSLRSINFFFMNCWDFFFMWLSRIKGPTSNVFYVARTPSVFKELQL